MSPEVVWDAVRAQRPDLLAKAMEDYCKVEGPVKVRT
jgi:hypothetical protein